jgi:hypothetical protein
MDNERKLTEPSARKAMLEAQRRRGVAAPGYPNAGSVHEGSVREFWGQPIPERPEIKRILGVGMSTLSDHIRLYKDPFVPS